MQLEIIRKESEDSSSTRPPILFVHGAYHAAWVWEKYQDFFAKEGYTSFAMSVRGHGASEGAAQVEHASLRDYVADIEEVLATFDTPPIIIGHSLGAALVRKVLESRAVSAAVLIGTPTSGSLFFGVCKLLLKYPLKTLRVLLSGDPHALYGSQEVLSFLYFNKEKDTAMIDMYVHRNLAQKEAKEFATELLMQKVKPFKGHAPVLVLDAGNDASTNEGYMQKLASLYGAEAHMVPGVPHNMLLATEWKRGAVIIAEWLSRTLK